MRDDINVFEFQIPKKYGAVVFFKNKDIMKHCCDNWEGYVPLIGNGTDPEAEKNLPGVFMAFREKVDYGFGVN